jgi:hypothetical protein
LFFDPYQAAFLHFFMKALRGLPLSLSAVAFNEQAFDFSLCGALTFLTLAGFAGVFTAAAGGTTGAVTGGLGAGVVVCAVASVVLTAKRAATAARAILVDFMIWSS